MQDEVEIIEIDDSYFERFERFKYLGTNLTVKILFSKNLRAGWRQGMLDIIRRRILCLAVCYKNVKIKVYRTVIFVCCFIGVWNLVADVEGGK
jgi:hypothetical protein